VFWDTILVKHGDVITRERSKFLHFIGSYVNFPIKGEITYDESIMSEARLHQYAMEEVAAGKTLVGPHRDNFLVKMQIAPERLDDVSRFWISWSAAYERPLAQSTALQFIEKETKTTPVLLLDDLFSELE